MTLPVVIQGHDHPKSGITEAKVTSTGALVTSAFAYDETKFGELGTAGTAVNFYKPKAGFSFVITGMIATGDKQIQASSDATVVVFEASNATTSTQDKVLLQFVLTQSTVISIVPLNIFVAEGKFINAETDDDDVHLNIMGYYIPS